MPPTWPSWLSSSSPARPSDRAPEQPELASANMERPSPRASWPQSLEARGERVSGMLLPSSMDAPLVRRQQNPIVIIPTTYSDMDDSPPPGTVIGAVLGSVFGFLLILYLIYSLFNRGGGAVVEEEDFVVREQRRGSRSSRHSHSHSHSHSRSSPPVPRSPVRTETRVEERVIVEETHRAATRSPEDEIVEVIEEEEEPPPRRSRGSRSRPTSGYRGIVPDQFAGGNLPMEEVYTRRSSRRR